MKEKNIQYFLHFIGATVFILFSTAVSAQELFFTYAGVIVQGGTNSINYKGWVNTQQKTIKSKGSVYGGGILTTIFVHQFSGQFSLTYMQYSSDSTPDLSVGHPLVTVKGTYYYPLNKVFQPGVGLGLYLDLPPASADYNGGAGGNISLSMLFTLSTEIKTIIDIYAQYGSFGMGESSTKTEGGILVGVVYKVGRL
ncbi:MAG: hypothetical protein N3F66_14860 [Spirochaetes bacterium]|nr:hypothetical protein [Spirochaetota bacterium]